MTAANLLPPVPLARFRARRRFVVLLTAAALCGSLAGPATVGANHPTPTGVKEYFDDNDNGVPDGGIPLYRLGTWSDKRKQRFLDATAEWQVESRYTPHVAGGYPAPSPDKEHYVYQGEFFNSPWCASRGPTTAAISCVRRDLSPTGYIRIYDIDIWVFNEARWGLTWSYDTPAEFVGHDFQGVLTHEIGHAARLPDLCNLLECSQTGNQCTFTSSAMHTMCLPAHASEQQHWPANITAWYRSLDADSDGDVRDVNRLYP